METYGRKALFALILCIFFYVPATASTFRGDCGFTIDLPDGIALKKDAGIETPLCSYLDSNPHPTPFVNSVTVLSWNKLDTLQVSGMPFREIGFFRLPRQYSVNYLGRPSYSDPKNLYEQEVVKKSPQKREVLGKMNRLTIRNELKVKWLKPIDSMTQEEVTETFVCVDAVISDSTSVAILNWCLPKNSPNVAGLFNMARSLQIGSQQINIK